MLRSGGITSIVFTCVTGGLCYIVNECTARGPGGRRFNLRAASSHPSSGSLFEDSGILTGCLCWRWFVRNLSCDKLVPVVDMVFPGSLKSMAPYWVVWLGIVRAWLACGLVSFACGLVLFAYGLSCVVPVSLRRVSRSTAVTYFL